MNLEERDNTEVKLAMEHTIMYLEKENKGENKYMDFSQLNMITERQAFPLPNVDRIFAR